MEEIILEGMVVNHDNASWRQVKISNGLIEKVGYGLGRTDLVLEDKLIFPGFIDLHVHAREDVSGKHNYKEDFVTVSEAALNGGVVAIADMPNNPIPPIDDQSYLAKKKLTEKAPIPILLYAGIGPNTSPLSFPVPYKVFTNDFKDNEQLEETIQRYQGQHISFHCEDPVILEKYKNEKTHEQRRPPEAEIEAIKFALELTERYNLETKICHLSTAEGLELCLEAKERGLNVTTEVTPHHLYFDSSCIRPGCRNTTLVKPPLRSIQDRLALLEALKEGKIDYLADDHAPHTFKDKMQGVSGMPHLDTYGLFVTWLIKEWPIKEQDNSLKRIAQVCSYNPAKFFNRFAGTKLGQIKPGYEAKFTIIDLNQPTRVTTSYLKTKCKWSPFEGTTFPGSVEVLKF